MNEQLVAAIVALLVAAAGWLETQMGQMNGTLNNILGKVDLLVTLKEKK